jgi:hypothetical protein
VTLYLLGVMTVLSVQPHWRRLAEYTRRAAIWCGFGRRVPMGVDETGRLVAYDPRRHSRDSEDFHQLIRTAWAPSTDDIWSTP